MSTILFDKLDSNTQSALQAVGISNDVQLAEICPQRLVSDLNEFYQFFPDAPHSIELNQVPRLCTKAQELLRLQGIEYTCEKSNSAGTASVPVEQYSSKGTSIIDPLHSQEAESSIPADDSFHRAVIRKPMRDIHKQGTGNAIRYKRSITCFLGAIATCLIYPILLVTLLFPVVMMVYNISFSDGKLYMGIGLSLGVLYYACTTLFRCQVCHVNIYSIRKFPRHRHAHRFSFLNTAIPTALVIIFRRWFRCPACGTAQILFKKKRPHKK